MNWTIDFATNIGQIDPNGLVLETISRYKSLSKLIPEGVSFFYVEPNHA